MRSRISANRGMSADLAARKDFCVNDSPHYDLSGPQQYASPLGSEKATQTTEPPNAVMLASDRGSPFEGWKNARTSSKIGVITIALILICTLIPGVKPYNEFLMLGLVWTVALLFARSGPLDRKLVKAAALHKVAIRPYHPAAYEQVWTWVTEWRRNGHQHLKNIVIVATCVLALQAVVIVSQAFWPLLLEYDFAHAGLVHGLVFVAIYWAIAVGTLGVWTKVACNKQVRMQLGETLPPSALFTETEDPSKDPVKLKKEIAILKDLDERISRGDVEALKAARDMYKASVLTAIGDSLFRQSTTQNWMIGIVFYLLGTLTPFLLAIAGRLG
jgi:hypothetical protein